MIVAIVDKTTPSGVVVVLGFVKAASAAAAVTKYCDRYSPARTESNYLGYDTTWSSYTHATAGGRWGYDFDGAPAGLVEVAVAENHSVNGGRVYYNRGELDVVDISSASGVLTIDCDAGSEQRCVLTENISSVVLSNKPGAKRKTRVTVTLVQDSTARTIPTSVTGVDWWANAAGGPVMPTGSGAELVMILEIQETARKSRGGWMSE